MPAVSFDQSISLYRTIGSLFIGEEYRTVVLAIDDIIDYLPALFEDVPAREERLVSLDRIFDQFLVCFFAQCFFDEFGFHSLHLPAVAVLLDIEMDVDSFFRLHLKYDSIPFHFSVGAIKDLWEFLEFYDDRRHPSLHAFSCPDVDRYSCESHGIHFYLGCDEGLCPGIRSDSFLIVISLILAEDHIVQEVLSEPYALEHLELLLADS